MLQAKPIGRGLTGSILSLSLLTVMAGAAVAPALNVIQAHFAQSSQTFVQMIISIPALFIVITNFFFPKLCRRLNPRTLVLLGLSLYTAGGCAAGLFDQIGLVLVMRALVGVGVGILMPWRCWTSAAAPCPPGCSPTISRRRSRPPSWGSPRP